MNSHTSPESGRLAHLIESALDERGWTKQDLADRIHVSRGAVYNWLRGDVPSADTCFGIARALEMNPLRVLEAGNYAPGVSGLLDLVEQLQAHQEQLLMIQTRIDPASSRSGLGLVVDAFAAAGEFTFRVIPWWRGSGASRRHFADLVVIEAEDPVITQASVEVLFQDVLARAMCWWEGAENWSHLLSGALSPSRPELVLNVPRFVANRRGGAGVDVRAPHSIVLVGGHWCGQAEAGRFLAETLDYDYALPSLAASVMHKTLAHRWNVPNWDRDRLDLVRTFALSTPVSRRRVWAADYWDDSESVRVITSAPTVPFVVFLEPTERLLRYAADRRYQDGHARDGRSRLQDLDVMRESLEAARSHVSTLRPDQLLCLSVDVPDGAWQGNTAAPLVDEWLDHFAATADRIYQALPAGA